MVTHHPYDGHPPTVYCSPTLNGMVITFPSIVTYHIQDCHLHLEFESSAAKLVDLVDSLAKLVTSSVALPAELVSSTLNMLRGLQVCDYTEIEDDTLGTI